MRKNAPRLIAILLLAAAAFAQGRKAKDEGWSDLMPPGDGRDLVMASCATCHNLKVVVLGRMNRDAWMKTINDMIQRGAPVFPEEIDPMAVYLSTVFGAAVPKPINVNTATRDDLAKLPTLPPDLVTRILDARAKAGAFRNAEALRQALSFEREEARKILYLLKYSD
jgi:helix-hairpin-helix protein